MSFEFLIQEAMVWPLKDWNIFGTPAPSNRPVTYEALKEECAVQHNPRIMLLGVHQQKCEYISSKDICQSVCSSIIGKSLKLETTQILINIKL